MTNYSAAAEAKYYALVAKWAADGAAYKNADWHRFMAACENADDTSVDEGFDRGTARWFEIWASSYEALCDDGAYDDEYPSVGGAR